MGLFKRFSALAGPGGADAAFRAELLRWFIRLGAIPAALAAAGVGVCLYFWATLPSLDVLERIAPSLPTQVFDRDSVLLKEYFSERRVWTPLEGIPRRQVQAVLAIEDRDFYRHGGVDLSAIPGAALPALVGRRARGASTITQQLSKLLYLSPERTLGRKIREVFLAVEIERTYTKREILEFYLNQVYMGAGVYGFAAASQRYFSRPLDSLTLAQQALLAGLLQRPEHLRPDRRPALALERRNLVLHAMARDGAIGREELRSARDEPLGLAMQAARAAPALEAPYFLDAAKRVLERRWGRGFLDSAGARVYTTLDRRIQDAADSSLVARVAAIQERIDRRTLYELGMARRLRMGEAAILRDFPRHWARFDSLFVVDSAGGAGGGFAIRDGRSLRRYPEQQRYLLRPKAQGAVVVLENGTGEVLALAGGIDWRASEFNRAVQAARSPGSAFKAVVYAAAVDRGASPAFLVDDNPIALKDPDDSAKLWRPHNLEYDYEGRMSLRRAFYRSRNIPAVLVGTQTGLDTVVAYARRLGLSRPMRAVPAMVLGGCDATPLEMAAAFAAFPSGGEWREPRLLRRVVDRDGSDLALPEPIRRRAMSEAAAWIMCGMLRDVNIRGTAAGVWAAGFRHPSGGKTGTSNDYRDAWYVGFTRRYTVGVWIGTDDHAPMGPGHAGTDAALPIWMDIVQALHKGTPAEDFARPKGVADVAVCKLTGRAPQAFCDSVLYDYRVAAFAKPLPACRPELHAAAEEAEEAVEGDGGMRAQGPETGAFFRKFWNRLKKRL